MVAIGSGAAVFVGQTLHTFSGISTNTVFTGILLAARHTLILAAYRCIWRLAIGASQAFNTFSRQRIADQPVTILRPVRTMAQAIILYRRSW